MPPITLPDLPPALAYPLGVLVVYRWGVIPALRGTLALACDWRRFRARDLPQEPSDPRSKFPPVVSLRKMEGGE